MVWHFFSPSFSLRMVWGQSLFLLIFCVRQSEIQKRVISGWIAEAAECDGWRGRENNAFEGEHCKKEIEKDFLCSIPFRGSIMDIFNAAQHALPLGPPALESFFRLIPHFSCPPSNLLLLINQEERKKWKMWCGSREENCNLVFVFPISSIQRNGQKWKRGMRNWMTVEEENVVKESFMFDCNLFTYERREKARRCELRLHYSEGTRGD